MTAIANFSLPSRIVSCEEWVKEFVIGRAPPMELPARVRQAIAADQRASEILVCFVQFGAIVTFGLLYALTPKAFPDTVPFEPIPWTLAAYTLFTAVRLWLAFRNRLTPLLLSVSVVVDIAVLMLTIWSFHLQYDAPAAIYLKAPTLMYAFVLIVLRCMRFEVRYVVLAGLSAGIGWLILVLYAVLETKGMHITHSYAEYVTSYAILIGAELDKAIAFGTVTLVLAIAIDALFRARRRRGHPPHRRGTQPRRGHSATSRGADDRSSRLHPSGSTAIPQRHHQSAGRVPRSLGARNPA
jgi:adenylate cyclase